MTGGVFSFLGLFRGLPITLPDDIWAALDRLERASSLPGFGRCWRAFMRDCAEPLLSMLPTEATSWFVAADEYEQGRMSAQELTAVRVQAWQFHDAHRDGRDRVESVGLRIVMYRLWAESDVEAWRESAWHFVRFCREAGMDAGRLLALLRARFEGLPDG